MIRQAWLTLPSCFASSSTPTLLRMIFSSLVIVSSPRSDTQCLPSETTPPPSQPVRFDLNGYKSSAGTGRTIGAQRRSPVDPLQQHRELRRAQRHRPLARLRPDEPAPLQPLAEQAETLAVPVQHLDQVAAPAAKDEQMPGERILPQHLLRQH